MLRIRETMQSNKLFLNSNLKVMALAASFSFWILPVLFLLRSRHNRRLHIIRSVYAQCSIPVPRQSSFHIFGLHSCSKILVSMLINVVCSSFYPLFNCPIWIVDNYIPVFPFAIYTMFRRNPTPFFLYFFGTKARNAPICHPWTIINIRPAPMPISFFPVHDLNVFAVLLLFVYSRIYHRHSVIG